LFGCVLFVDDLEGSCSSSVSSDSSEELSRPAAFVVEGGLERGSGMGGGEGEGEVREPEEALKSDIAGIEGAMAALSSWLLLRTGRARSREGRESREWTMARGKDRSREGEGVNNCISSLHEKYSRDLRSTDDRHSRQLLSSLLVPHLFHLLTLFLCFTFDSARRGRRSE
jgi:hypothetical protein